MRKSKWTKELLANQRTAREIPDFFADGRINGMIERKKDGRINGMIAQKKDGRICKPTDSQSAWKVVML